MAAARKFFDGIKNLVANLGTDRDKAAGNYYGAPCLTDEQLLNAYRGAWLPRKLVDIPAKDACRKWRTWSASKEEITAIEAEEKRLNVRGKVLEARIKARLFGGAAILIGDGSLNPSTPLRPDAFKQGGIRHLTVLTRRQLTPTELETDPYSERFGKPKMYRLAARGDVQIHPSRLVVFIGASLPDDELAGGNEHGWGDSVLLAPFAVVKQSDGTTANIASLIFEAKIDVIRIPNLMNNMADSVYEAQLLERLELAAIAKGINGTLLLDKEEEYEQKTANFANLTELMMAFLQQVAGAADIPMTRLLGQSPGGLNSSGESDLRNYYDHVSADQEMVMAPAMALLDECLIRSALGKRPPEVYYTWSSLWQTKDTERAEIGAKAADTIKKLDETGLFPDMALARAAVNMLVETGVMPGLEEAIDEFGLEVPDDEVDEEQAATTIRNADAAPRSLYVSRKVLNADEIIAWAKSQGFNATLPADDLHVTIAFSRQAVDWMKVGEAWGSDPQGGMTIAPGGARLLDRFGEGAVVLLFNSSELAWRHMAIREAGASWDWPDYQPHITLTYEPGAVDLDAVEPYRGRIELGPEIFEEVDSEWREKIKEVA
jgi:phage-related protein (TIGR01555 family)